MKAFQLLKVCAFCFLSTHTIGSLAQEKKDSSNLKKDIAKLMNVIAQRKPTALHERSEESYLPYEGKIIRKIVVKHIGFERAVLDTARTLENFISKTANKLHPNTKEYVVRNNLFIREGTQLSPYRIADNERWLRNLNFILDARIYVSTLSQKSDSVDLLVITRDVFGLGGSFEPSYPTKYQLSVQDVNLGGRGQAAQFGQVIDQDRIPQYAYEGYYQINNINGSFIDGAVGYTKLNTGISIGNENESSFYVKFNRALYHPFARVAGGIELSYNKSNNVYQKPDSTFAKYDYSVQDYWIGYSLRLTRLLDNQRENRNRMFIAFRRYDQYFLSSANTELTEPDRFAYRNLSAWLTQFTFFRQEFYKTQYVLGFGRTEDVPYGYRISLTSGWERELGSKRPYLGSELYYNKVTQSGTILTYDANVASYFHGTQSQDGYVSFNFTRYSKINKLGNMILRYQVGGGYAAIFNQNVKRGLNIRDVNGLLGFLPDSLVGSQRIAVTQELTIFTPYKFLGFHLAPIVRMDLALIRSVTPFIESRNFFSGFSIGTRARNENLIFNTVEARLFYYPKIVERLAQFSFSITTNFRIKYPSNLVNKPATVFP